MPFSVPGELLGRMRSPRHPFPRAGPCPSRRKAQLAGSCPAVPSDGAVRIRSFYLTARAPGVTPNFFGSGRLAAWSEGRRGKGGPGREPGLGTPGIGSALRVPRDPGMTWKLWGPFLRIPSPHACDVECKFRGDGDASSGEMGPRFKKPVSIQRGKFAKVLLFDAACGSVEVTDTRWKCSPRPRWRMRGCVLQNV